jgi:integrase
MTVELKAQREQSSNGPYNRFMYALKAPESKRQYPKRLEVFLKFINISGLNLEERLYNLYHKSKSDTEWLQDSLIDFIVFQKERAFKGEITESTIPNYYKPVKLFCDMNDIVINWRIITRGMPRGNHAANDRTPTLEEIIQILNYPDVRIKAIILTMISSGIRVGAWDYLRWKHVIPVEVGNDIVASKVIVYAGETDQYFSFITPEAYRALKAWMDFRSSYGEKITGESWVMRDMWKTTNITYGAKLGYARTPVKFKGSGIRNLISKALFQQNVRPILKEGQKRHEFKTAHGFRKFFKTQAEQTMKAANVEMLMGHDLGISKSYYKPQEKAIMEDYLKAVKNLTVLENINNEVFKKEIDELREKNENNEHIIKSRLQEKDDALVTLSDQVMKLMKEMQELKSTKR